ncbi:MAG: hypothetical protein LC104_14540 [Bacteroidales bacterium]|nr:hypothetical protein [Bacteroidales bacterium]
MRVQIAPSPPSAGPGHTLSTFLIDETIAIDAGGLGMSWPPEALARIHDVFITHSHIDHLAGLAVFLDTIYDLGPPPTIHASAATLRSIRKDVFNDRLFPDFVKLSRIMPPFLTLAEIDADIPVSVGKYQITPIAVHHTIPTVNYLIDDGETVLAILTDTAPVPSVFARVAATPRLGAVLLECSFPSHQARLADISKHLTPSQFREAVGLLPSVVPVYAIHIKPRFYTEIVAELNDLDLLNFQGVAEPGDIIEVRPPAVVGYLSAP